MVPSPFDLYFDLIVRCDGYSNIGIDRVITRSPAHNRP